MTRALNFSIHVAFGVALSLLVAHPARAAWPHDPFANVHIAATDNLWAGPTIATDGAGGAFIAWSGSSAGGVQRVGQDGNILWAAGGVSLGSEMYAPSSACADGSGGVIVIGLGWQVGVGDRLYVQRLSSNGERLWVATGLPLDNAGASHYWPQVIPDGSGGATAYWTDDASGQNLVRGQRIAANGTIQWGPGGVVISGASGVEQKAVATSDGAGGAYVCWSVSQGGTHENFIQRVSPSGLRLWGADGIAVRSLMSSAYEARLVSPANGGVIVAWSDDRNGPFAVYAQKFSENGTPEWLTNGLPIASAPDAQGLVELVSDGDGGAIVVWQDYGSATLLNVQRIAPNGSGLWGVNGVKVRSGGTYPMWLSGAVSDGLGGTIVYWMAERSSGRDFFAKRVSNTGQLLWSPFGAAICVAPNEQRDLVVIPNGAGGAIFAWTDLRRAASSSVDIYAQGIDLTGAQFYSEPRIAEVSDVPNDQGGKVRVKWTASQLDHPAGGLALYGLWRQVSAAAAQKLSPESTGSSRGAVPGVVRTTTGLAGDTYWEGVGTVVARGYENYSFTTFTFQDSSATTNPQAEFMVDFHSGLWPEYWSSEPASGYSVDNIAPLSPANIRLAPGQQLEWDAAAESDFDHYTVYASATGQLDGSAALLAVTTNTYFSPGSITKRFLLVTASDIHGNASIPAVLSATSDAPSVPAPVILCLYPCQPNPFNPRTTIKFDLPATGWVRLVVFDVAGRRVRTLVDETLGGGSCAVVWDGRDDAGREVGSGGYVARLEYEGKSASTRLGLVR